MVQGRISIKRFNEVFQDPKLQQQIRLLEYDSENQFWFFHPLYVLLNVERSAFGNFYVECGGSCLC